MNANTAAVLRVIGGAVVFGTLDFGLMNALIGPGPGPIFAGLVTFGLVLAFGGVVRRNI